MPDGPLLPLSVNLRQAPDESDLTVQPPSAANESTTGEQPSVEPPSTNAEYLLPAGSQLELRIMSMPLQVLFVLYVSTLSPAALLAYSSAVLVSQRSADANRPLACSCLIHLCLALAGVGYVDSVASVPLDRSFVSSPADPLHPRS
jgi:hypothetical protein